MKTSLMLEQHIHGAFGVDFNKADTDDIIYAANKLLEHGIGAVFPTLVTDSVENIRRQTDRIKQAALKCKLIAGIHLEGIFINPEKKGIHNPEHFLPLTEDSYKLIEDDFIKIVTLAPELDKGLINYLKNKGVKVQAGHCIGGDLDSVYAVTHTFNAMSGFNHRGKSTALSAMASDNLYAEIIADGVHVSDKALKIFFRSKPDNRVILISDALPITESEIKETIFADSKIYYDGKRAASADGTIAGSTTLLNRIVKRLIKQNLFNPQYIENPWHYHRLEPQGEIQWDSEGNIIQISL